MSVRPSHVILIKHSNHLPNDCTIKKNQQFFKGDLGNKLNISGENVRVKVDESQINIALIQWI